MEKSPSFYVLQELERQTKLLYKIFEKLEKSETTETGDYLTVKQVAQVMNRSPATIRRWVAQEKLYGMKLHRGGKKDHYVIHRTAIDNMILKAQMK